MAEGEETCFDLKYPNNFQTDLVKVLITYVLPVLNEYTAIFLPSFAGKVLTHSHNIPSQFFHANNQAGKYQQRELLSYK